MSTELKSGIEQAVAAAGSQAKLADMLVGLRVDLEHETQGLDFATHGETGYHTSR